MTQNGLWLEYETHRGACGGKRLERTRAACLKALRNIGYIHATITLNGEKIGERFYLSEIKRYSYWLNDEEL
jgi:hypothetical protein